MYFQSVLTDKVHQPLATVRVVSLYQMCSRVAYLCVAFLPHIAKVCEFWIDLSVRTLPVHFVIHVLSSPGRCGSGGEGCSRSLSTGVTMANHGRFPARETIEQPGWPDWEGPTVPGGKLRFLQSGWDLSASQHMGSLYQRYSRPW